MTHSNSGDHATPKFDGGSLAIMAARFDAIARRMANALMRTGRSGVLNRAKDLSCCIVSARHELVVTADSLPIHVLSGPDLMSRSLCELHTDMRPGDAYLNNSPYHGCSHTADHTILVPVFDDKGEHCFTLIVKAHQADIGNSVPTTYFGGARDVYEEGALIFPNVRVATDRAVNEDVVRMCELRIRAPKQWRGDFQAMLGAAWTGERDLHLLAEAHGWDYLRAFVREWLDYSERVMLNAVRALPGGISEALTVHDPMPGTPADGVKVRVRVEIKPEAAQIVVDARDNPDQMANGLNLSEACARTAALIGIFNSIPASIPKNAGAFRPIKILLREGSCVGVPLHPASCSTATTNLADRLSGAVQLAISGIGEGLGMAEIGPVNPPSKGVVSGIDPRKNEFFIDQMFLGSTGGAASSQMDGWLTHSHSGNAGMSLVDSVELAELSHPLIIRERMLLPDSEGAGTYIGAPALRTVLEIVADDIQVAYASDGTHNPARGARGGGDGYAAAATLIRKGAEPEILPNIGVLRLSGGDVVVSVGTGGGGYGPPDRRPEAAVAVAMEDGLLSVERAENIYGVRAPR